MDGPWDEKEFLLVPAGKQIAADYSGGIISIREAEVMNSLERVKAVLAGQIPDRVPVCLHNFMLAAHEAGIPMEKYRTDPQAIARTHLQALEKYGHDCILIDLDTTMLAEAMGARSECAPNEPGRIVAPAIHSLDEVDGLPVVNPETRRADTGAAGRGEADCQAGGRRGSHSRQRRPGRVRPGLHGAWD